MMIGTGIWSPSKDQKLILLKILLVALGIILLVAPVIELNTTIVYGLSIIGIIISIYIARKT